MKAICDVCFRRCEVEEGRRGACLARTNEGGHIVPANYGELTAVALDPIEKKPLARFYPGSQILSVGSYGCNLKCPFCQNYEISQTIDRDTRRMTPEELCGLALRLRNRGNIGVAFTYNEPLINWEYVRDTARLTHEAGLKNVLVTNGCISLHVLHALQGLIDAMNIDLKGFSDEFYSDFLQGDRAMTMAFIEEAVKCTHVELTTLIIPGRNDSEEEMRAETEWIRGLKYGNGADIPLHISRYFPRYKLRTPATDVRAVLRLADVARENLTYVYTGNI